MGQIHVVVKHFGAQSRFVVIDTLSQEQPMRLVYEHRHNLALAEEVARKLSIGI